MNSIIPTKVARLSQEEQRDLLEKAIAQTGLSNRRFAVEVLNVDETTLRRWIGGKRRLSGPAQRLCQQLLDRC